MLDTLLAPHTFPRAIDLHGHEVRILYYMSLQQGLETCLWGEGRGIDPLVHFFSCFSSSLLIQACQHLGSAPFVQPGSARCTGLHSSTLLFTSVKLLFLSGAQVFVSDAGPSGVALLRHLNGGGWSPFSYSTRGGRLLAEGWSCGGSDDDWLESSLMFSLFGGREFICGC